MKPGCHPSILCSWPPPLPGRACSPQLPVGSRKSLLELAPWSVPVGLMFWQAESPASKWILPCLWEINLRSLGNYLGLGKLHASKMKFGAEVILLRSVEPHGCAFFAFQVFQIKMGACVQPLCIRLSHCALRCLSQHSRSIHFL